MTWLLDLDGVVWLSGRAINGSPEAIERLRRSGQRVVFFTNNSGPTVAEQLAFLAGAGVVTNDEELLTSSQAAASLLEAGTRAAFIGDAGIAEALIERGIEIVPATGNPDAVVVGRTTNLSYDGLAEAATAIRDGARFVATNADATLPTPDGPMPGAGAIVAFLQVSSGKTPVVAGKPTSAAADLVSARLGKIDVVVGDRPETDGLFAREMGARFALVLSGVTSASDLPVEPVPDLVGADLGAIVSEAFGLPQPRESES
jgi:glycerol 3-phosphatase-2